MNNKDATITFKCSRQLKGLLVKKARETKLKLEDFVINILEDYTQQVPGEDYVEQYTNHEKWISEHYPDLSGEQKFYFCMLAIEYEEDFGASKDIARKNAMSELGIK